MKPRYGRAEAQSWPWDSGKNNNIEITSHNTCLILQNVVCSVIRIGFDL